MNTPYAPHISGTQKLAIALILFALVAAIGIKAASATEYTRQGGTADFACCADPNCATVIPPQYAREWAAKDACTKLTDADGITRYVRQWPMRVYRSGTVEPTCPPKPADDTATGTCPAGTIGSWPQVQSYGSVAYPTCWVPSGFIPSAPPEGACKVPPPAPLATPTGLSATVASNVANPANYDVTLTWTAVTGAANYDVERCPGASCTNFARIDGATGPTYANTNLPAGLTYRYRVRALAPPQSPSQPSAAVAITTPAAPPPPATGTARLSWSWNGPPLNTAGQPVTIAGYRILYSTVGTAGPSLSQTLSLGAVTTHELTGLAAGRWAFAIESVDAQGLTSQPSNLVYRDVP